MRSLSSSCRTRFPAGLLLVATLAPLLNVARADIIAVSPGELQAALDNAKPGDTIKLKAGEYWETVVTKTDGRADAYITIEGESDSNDAVLKGDVSIDNDGRIFNIEHSYYHLDGFRIDGMHSPDNYVDKCLYVQQNRDNENLAEEIEFNGHKFRSSINGLVLSNMEITNCGGECIRMRYFITYAQVYDNWITNCGVHDFKLDGNAKNGEGIYLGTSSNQWDDGKNPSNEPDVSCYNHFFGNHFDTQGNEGIDIKEGSKFNIVEDNYCTGQLDPLSACLDARGDSNIFRYNTCVKNLGAGVRIGGHDIGGHQYGQNNEVYGNILQDNEYAGVKIMFGPQGAVCGNDVSGSEDDVKGSDFARSLEPKAACETLEDIANDEPPLQHDGDEYVPPLQHDGSGTVTDCDCHEVKRLEKKLKMAKKACRKSKERHRHDDGSYDDSDDYDDDDDMDDDSSMDDDSGMDSDDEYSDEDDEYSDDEDSDDDDEDSDDDDEDSDDDDEDSDDEIGGPEAAIRVEQAGDDQTCSNGLPGFEAADVCCPLWCGRCGGSGCSEIGKECCTNDVKDTEVKCSETGLAPCIIDDRTDGQEEPPEQEQGSDAQKCSNGLPGYEASDVCCPVSCGRCGGDGCSDLGEECCTSKVKDTEVKCSEAKTAPCIIDTEFVDVEEQKEESTEEENEEKTKEEEEKTEEEKNEEKTKEEEEEKTKEEEEKTEEEKNEENTKEEEEEKTKEEVAVTIIEETEGTSKRDYLAREDFEPPTMYNTQHL